ncbi:hypothetical protein Xph01_10200 [Micromonospora phaseoli]|nr:hypothetical protein Xph01_10200 [Micromonospora phaseoli]
MAAARTACSTTATGTGREEKCRKDRLVAIRSAKARLTLSISASSRPTVRWPPPVVSIDRLLPSVTDPASRDATVTAYGRKLSSAGSRVPVPLTVLAIR